MNSPGQTARRQTGARTELPIIQKTYDLLRWLIPRLNEMPRNQRFLLGDRIETTFLNLQGLLIEASFERTKLPLLQKASAELEKLRFLIRLIEDLHVLGRRRAAYLMEGLAEVGRMLGGWIKERQKKERALEAP